MSPLVSLFKAPLVSLFKGVAVGTSDEIATNIPLRFMDFRFRFEGVAECHLWSVCLRAWPRALPV